jgi:hypothetical protein
VSNVIAAKRRRFGNVATTSSVVLVVLAALVVLSLGLEIAYNAVQTSGYSLGSIAVSILYIVFVVAFPLICARVYRIHNHGGIDRPLMVVAIISLVAQLCWLPIALLVFSM